MRAESLPLYRRVRPVYWLLVAAAICLAIVLLLGVVELLIGGLGRSPEQLLMAPFRWNSADSTA